MTRNIMPVLVVVLGGLLAYTMVEGAGATAEANLLHAQLDTAKAEIVEYALSRVESVARTDSLAAHSDSVQRESDALISELRATAEAARVASTEAFEDAVELVPDSLPELRVAIVRMNAEFQVERFAWEQTDQARVRAADALRMQITGFGLERIAWQDENESLRRALSLSEQESAARKRAAQRFKIGGGIGLLLLAAIAAL